MEETGRLSKFLVRPIRPSDGNWVKSFIKSRWGAEIVVAKGRAIRPAELDGLAAFNGKHPIGLLTYDVAGPDCEIVTLDSTTEGEGVGTALINNVREAAKAKGCKRLWLITTNDNLNALGFYQRRGFYLVALYPNALETSRKIKPQISLKGANGIPIRDELELELNLTG
jgi:ribosomal protein S18 acetylase RimI-like enzyme